MILSIKIEKKVVTISTKEVAEVRIGFTAVVVATMSSYHEFLKSACEDAGGIEGIFTWPRSVETKQTFDEKLFREQNPELAEKFTKIGESIKAVIVNPKRGY